MSRLPRDFACPTPRPKSAALVVVVVVDTDALSNSSRGVDGIGRLSVDAVDEGVFSSSLDVWRATGVWEVDWEVRWYCRSMDMRPPLGLRMRDGVRAGVTSSENAEPILLVLVRVSRRRSSGDSHLHFQWPRLTARQCQILIQHRRCAPPKMWAEGQRPRHGAGVVIVFVQHTLTLFRMSGSPRARALAL